MAVVRPSFFLFFTLLTKSVQAGDDPEVNLTDVKITYIELLREGKVFILAEGLYITEDESYLAFPCSLLCECRKRCRIDPRCNGSSLQIVDGKSVCRLTDEHARRLNLQRQENASYMFNADTPPNIFYGMGKDGLFYHVPSKYLGYESSVKSCQKIPGHRLAKFGTATDKQKAAMKLIQGYVDKDKLWVDDGTENTYITDGEIETDDDSMKTWYLCQANPLDKDW